VKRGKTGALVDRLILHKDKYMLWFTDISVPFDNNQAERDIRMFKVKLKVSGCFRSMQGANEFAMIASYVGTARKNGVNAFLAIKSALLHDAFLPSFISVTE
jgi:transposase